MGTGFSHYRGEVNAWRQRHRLVVKDLPGHGRGQDLASGDVFEQMLAVVCSWLAAGDGPSNLIGISYLGSALTLHAAVSHPEYCQSVVVTGYAFDMPPARLRAWSEGFVTAVAEDPAAAARFDRVHGLRWRDTVERVAESFPNWYARVGPQEIVSADCRLLVLNGSLLGPERESAAEVAGHGVNIDSGIIPGAGHMAHQDQPVAYHTIVESFWSRVSTTSAPVAEGLR
jgi:pimeloyl-ACP methyl ester carboxylesterase